MKQNGHAIHMLVIDSQGACSVAQLIFIMGLSFNAVAMAHQ